MPVLNNGQWEAPFWGASKSFITGQDMLGMQNTSIATYSTLLPGLTNLTRRIRYYGFYMWMLEQYAKTKGKVSVSEFQRFMRRKLAELFESTIAEDTHNRYLGAIDRGAVTRKELSDFGKEFSVTAIEPYSGEWNFYIKMLFGKDFPTVDASTGHTTFRIIAAS